MSLLERMAHDVAYDAAPELKPQNPDEKGVEIITIITAIIAIFKAVMDNCPLPQNEKADALRRPSIPQSAYLARTCREYADVCDCRMRAGAIYRAMRRRGGALNQEEAAALVKEASDDSNLLI